MPNWCSTTYYVTGPEKELKSLRKKLKAWTEGGKLPSDFGKNWLGHIAEGLGEDWRKVRCRGTLDLADMEEKNGEPVLHLETKTAWGPAHELWDRVVAKEAPHCGYYYFTEEPGVELYQTNDVQGEFFPFDYVVDACWGTCDHEEFREYFGEGIEEWTAKDLERVLRSLLKEETVPLPALVEKLDILQRDWKLEDQIFIHEVDKAAA